MTSPKLIIAILLSFSSYTNAQLVTNRAVECLSTAMVVKMEFSSPFNGMVYANKFYEKSSCRWEGNGSRTLTANVPLNTNADDEPYCGVTVKEGGSDFTLMLVVTPLIGLLVEGMSGIQVLCSYSTNDLTITMPSGSPYNGGLYIEPQSNSAQVSGAGGSPSLMMTIRDGHGIEQAEIQAAAVGQRITLDVAMQDTTIYDYWIHDCFAHDGTKKPEASIVIIDENGCAVRLARAVDVPVFTTTPVNQGAKHVYVHMYGFQFTTSQLVYFECQVRPCLRDCQRPQCNQQGSPRIRRDTNETSIARHVRQAQFDDPNKDYKISTILAIKPRPADVLPARDDPLPSIAQASLGEHICIQMHVGIAILIIFVCVCLVSLIITAYVCWRAQADDTKLLSSTSELSSGMRGQAANHRLASRLAYRFGNGYYTPSSTPSRRLSMSSNQQAVAGMSETTTSDHAYSPASK